MFNQVFYYFGKKNLKLKLLKITNTMIFKRIRKMPKLQLCECMVNDLVKFKENKLTFKEIV